MDVLRIGLNLGNKALVRQDGDHLTGIAPDLALRLAAHLHRSPRFLTYDSARQLAADYEDGWDIAFLAIDQSRPEALVFSRSHTTIESTLAVRGGSPVTLPTIPASNGLMRGPEPPMTTERPMP